MAERAASSRASRRAASGAQRPGAGGAESGSTEATASKGEAREDAPPWHALDTAEVERHLDVTAHGLSAGEIEARRAHHGPNRLEEEPPPLAIVVFARQFASPLIYILLAAAAVTFVLAEYIDAAVIAAVLLLNASIGFTQERKAEGAVRALMQLVVPRALVVRDGEEWEIDSIDLVPGDVVLLEPGSRVPADLRLTSATALRIDESLLTGESLPVTKRIDPVDEKAPLADRAGMAYSGTSVTTGRGRGVVVATGARSELGATAELLRGERVPATPLQRRMGRFAKIVGLAVGISSLVAFLSGIALGEPAQDMFLTAVALAVAAIPEGLPVVFTVTLALGVHRMAQRNAIIRRLPAVETLGSTTVIGSDKTGTLTENKMAVRAIWSGQRFFELSGEGRDAELRTDGHAAAIDDHPALHRTLLAGVLTNEAEVHRTQRGGFEVTGDPTDAAVVMSAMAAGILTDDARETYVPFAEIPFEPDLRYSANVRVREGRQTVFVKGAPERVVDMCAQMLTDDGVVSLDRDEVLDASRGLAGDALRVLAMAYLPLEGDSLDHPDEISEPRGLVFLGLQGMMDPPRAGVRESIEVCHEAGVRVVMITGDHEATARSIAARLDLASHDAEVLTGVDVAEMDDERLRERVRDVAVYARVAPQDKLRIVHALQHRGEVVAVTGDGVNDAPALRAAAIGVAMGRSGTDVAREASDMVLADDNFVSITAAVEEGRVTFDNVRNVTFFLISSGAAMIAALVVGVWLGWPLIMLPAQLLWLNLVTNGVQDLALAFEPGQPGVLRRPPRSPKEGILSRVLWERTFLVGVVMAAGTLLIFRWELDRTGDLALAQTAALTTMVVFKAFQAGTARSESLPVLKMSPFSNPFLLMATICALGIHVAALYLPPTQFILRVEPIDPAAWIPIVAVASTILIVVEGDKLLRRWLERRRMAVATGR